MSVRDWLCAYMCVVRVGENVENSLSPAMSKDEFGNYGKFNILSCSHRGKHHQLVLDLATNRNWVNELKCYGYKTYH